VSIRVLVVDDTVVFRRIVSDALAGLPGVEVLGTASNGKLALARMSALQPDLVTLDIEMPEMNGIEVLEAMGPAGLKAGVIVLSSLTERGGEMTVRALELGAFDFITKPDRGSPAENLAHLRACLQPMIRAFERRRDIRMMLHPESAHSPRSGVPSVRLSSTAPTPVMAVRRRPGHPLVLIGVSTGGPAALASLLPALPGDLNAPVLIVQHMPALFTKPLAESLDRKSAIRVKEAKDGAIAEANCAYLAPGGAQMKVFAGPHGETMLRITDDPPENGCKPAVDYLFRSVALQFPGRAVAAILTGMGSDGTAGLRLLKRGGCSSIAQDEASCVVFGMPKEAIAAGLVDTVAPIDRIAAAIVRSVREGIA
jgi:two-component system chemotaxis response regulator CheB